jgi:hypothetical protein
LARYIDTFSLKLNIPDSLVSSVISFWTFNESKQPGFEPSSCPFKTC